jgi:drug/metabolite transporter (DMT)-like permease
MVLVYTALISSADAITKLVSGSYSAPQMFFVSSFVVMGLSVLADRHPKQRLGLKTVAPLAMGLRSAATIIAACSFFYAFKFLHFAEVFIFIGLMPIFAGLFSAVILKEKIKPVVWGALAFGFVGVLCLFPTGVSGVGIGHGFALMAAAAGTFSMVMARYIGRYETNALAQVFYPNLALFVAMGSVLPMLWVPMVWADISLIVGYAVCLFAARWLSVVALRLLPAYAVTPLMNIQFVWMVALGAAVFGEVPSTNLFVGVFIIIATGLFLVWDQFAAKPVLPVLPALSSRHGPKLRPRPVSAPEAR